MQEELQKTDIIVEAPDVVPASEAVELVEEPRAAATPLANALQVPRASNAELATRFIVSITIAALNGALFIVAFSVWIFLLRKIFFAAAVHGGLRGELLVVQAMWLAPLLADPLPAAGFLFATALALGWTTLHLIRNKPLSWTRWPFLLLVWGSSAFMFPAAGCAYAVGFGIPEAVFAGGELGGRALQWVMAKLFGAVDLNLLRNDLVSAMWIVLALCATPFLAMHVLDLPLLFAIVSAITVLQGLHLYWNRRVTHCIENADAIRWERTTVTMLQERRDPKIKIEMATKNEVFHVRHTAESVPLELLQFEIGRARQATVGFDKISNRPVAIKIGTLVFPLTKSFVGLP